MTREEAIKIINCYDIGFYDLSGTKIPADKLVEAFDMAIEALQAEPKRGTWTITETYDCEGGEIPHLICSECKSEPMAWSSKRFFNYCPNCGAKMKGQEE